MHWEQALARRLLDDSAVADIEGGRVDWSRREDGAPLPAIVLEIISDARPQTHDGFDAVRPTRVRVHAMAQTRKVAVALREAIIATATPRGTFDGVWFDRAEVDAVRDLGSSTDTSFIERKSIDFIIWHTEQGE